MYIPPLFEITDHAKLHQIIRDHSFGILVSQMDGAPFATHLPFMIAPDKGSLGPLLFHMARTNPQWRSFGADEVLVVFSGPHGYISPSWYGPGDAVPTWNYVAVHAYGVPVLAEDDEDTVDHLRQLVEFNEARFDHPWKLDAQDPDFIQGTSRGVVAFEIPINRIEGKAKLSQNRPESDRQSVADALKKTGSPRDLNLALSMRAHNG
ncbi:MAG: FMN-binding negative transcriptional regulator [Proteobacteria bacterium]|nr:FMN-binding negative transcriptional regulator [Pseudomonadota bacterium]